MWVKVNRELVRNLLARQTVYSPAEAWLDVTLRAVQKTSGERTKGEVQASYGELALAWGWTPAQVRGFLADRLADGDLLLLSAGRRRQAARYLVTLLGGAAARETAETQTAAQSPTRTAHENLPLPLGDPEDATHNGEHESATLGDTKPAALNYNGSSTQSQRGLDNNAGSVTTTKEEREREKPQTRAGARAYEGFDRFWRCYPKRVARARAEKAWRATRETRPPLERLLAKLEELKASARWREEGGRYIPMPATWLNAGGWDDEVTVDLGNGASRDDLAQAFRLPLLAAERIVAGREEPGDQMTWATFLRQLGRHYQDPTAATVEWLRAKVADQETAGSRAA